MKILIGFLFLSACGALPHLADFCDGQMPYAVVLVENQPLQPEKLTVGVVCHDGRYGLTYVNVESHETPSADTNPDPW